MDCCTRKAPLSSETSSYITVFFSGTTSFSSVSTGPRLILAWPSINRSTTLWRFASASNFSMSAPHRGQSLKRDIHALYYTRYYQWLIHKMKIKRISIKKFGFGIFTCRIRENRERICYFQRVVLGKLDNWKGLTWKFENHIQKGILEKWH